MSPLAQLGRELEKVIRELTLRIGQVSLDTSHLTVYSVIRNFAAETLVPQPAGSTTRPISVMFLSD
jgi:hypothetical protein